MEVKLVKEYKFYGNFIIKMVKFRGGDEIEKEVLIKKGQSRYA
jgi:hypothetical protein